MACCVYKGHPIFGRHRLDDHHRPITFDGMHLATGPKNAPELAYRAFWIVHVDDRVSRGQPIQRFRVAFRLHSKSTSTSATRMARLLRAITVLAMVHRPVRIIAATEVKRHTTVQADIVHGMDASRDGPCRTGAASRTGDIRAVSTFCDSRGFRSRRE